MDQRLRPPGNGLRVESAPLVHRCEPTPAGDVRDGRRGPRPPASASGGAAPSTSRPSPRGSTSASRAPRFAVEPDPPRLAMQLAALARGDLSFDPSALAPCLDALARSRDDDPVVGDVAAPACRSLLHGRIAVGAPCRGGVRAAARGRDRRGTALQPNHGLSAPLPDRYATGRWSPRSGTRPRGEQAAPDVGLSVDQRAGVGAGWGPRGGRSGT